MKKIFTILATFVIFLSFTTQVYAVHVNGYYRSNGTYVNSYERTAPDGNPYNNYSYPGNYNPNTGQITGGNPDTYLNNYYNNSSGSSYSPSPSYYPTTPTCPANSYYDGVDSCKCSYGYVVSGSSCVSADSICYSQLGYSSSYDSLSNSCKCSYGYVIGDYGQCVSGNSWCSSKIGVMSQYNNSTKKCECVSGYEYDGSSCVYKSPYSAPAYTSPATYCPTNSYAVGTQCYCNSGYVVSGNACIPSQNHASPATAPTPDPIDLCTQKLGSHGIVVSQGMCGCAQGYYLNEQKTSCLENPVITTTPTPTPPQKVEPVVTEAKKITPPKNLTASTTPKKILPKKNVDSISTSTSASVVSTSTSTQVKKDTFIGKIGSFFKNLFK